MVHACESAGPRSTVTAGGKAPGIRRGGETGADRLNSGRPGAPGASPSPFAIRRTRKAHGPSSISASSSPGTPLEIPSGKRRCIGMSRFGPAGSGEESGVLARCVPDMVFQARALGAGSFLRGDSRPARYPAGNGGIVLSCWDVSCAAPYHRSLPGEGRGGIRSRLLARGGPRGRAVLAH